MRNPDYESSLEEAKLAEEKIPPQPWLYRASQLRAAHFFNARLGCGLQMSLGHNRDTQGLSPNKLLEKDSLCLGRIVGGSAGGTMIEAQSRPKAEIQPEMQK